MGLKEEVIEMRKEVKEVKEQSLAWEILSDYKRSNEMLEKANKRQFIIILVILILWFLTGCYLVYILNDIGTIETTEQITQNNDNGYNNYIGNDGDINNGISKDKENK